ncbi:hypothetical protein [Macrococcus equipercicus]|uniref:Uncharacterized protein n=1 Tax=Macrococcus equipercicus TaxID=69967 RepID=A0A9Q9F3J6_9STAP|nr:hypothetical protein [Macrococcus equipercicus]UTH14129.1 hypothetical protein KFV11_01785 [Macrococcus equipercicus]
MEKWLRLGFGIGAGIYITKDVMGYVRKLESRDQVTEQLNQLQKYSGLATVFLTTTTALLKNHSDKNKKGSAEVSAVADETVTTDGHVPKESVSDSVKSILDTGIVSAFVTDQQKVDRIKDVVDEAAKVEKFLRGWLK